jgi:heme-degrading monooxygenase HmoA
VFARVTTVQVPPDKLDDSLRYVREQVLPTVQGLDGFKGMYQLVDRTAGRVLGITLWETQEALQNSAPVAQRLRSGAQDRGASGMPTADEYEVTIQP